MSKPTCTINALIQRLKIDYKIAISEEYEPIAKSYLNFISYTRLKPYFITLSIDEQNIDFHKVIKYYDLDRKLKLLALDGLERIEIATRAIIVNHMPMKLYTSDEFWYCNEFNFNDEQSFHRTVSNFIDCIYKSNDVILKLFQNTHQASFNTKSWNDIDYIFKAVYKIPKFKLRLSDLNVSANDILILNNCHTALKTQLPTSYKLLLDKIDGFINNNELINKLDLLAFIVHQKRIPGYLLIDGLTFGKISLLYSTLKHSYRQKLTNIFYGSSHNHEKIFIKHLKLLCDIRNEVAHHANLFKTQKLKPINDLNTEHAKKSVFAYFELIYVYLNLIAPKNSFKEKLLDLVDKYANEYSLNVKYWG